MCRRVPAPVPARNGFCFLKVHSIFLTQTIWIGLCFRYEVPDDYDGCVNDEEEDNNPNSPVNNNDTILKNGGSCCWRQWKPSVTSKEPERVYNAIWFPLMDSGDPASCCFASTSRLVVVVVNSILHYLSIIYPPRPPPLACVSNNYTSLET